MSRYAEITQQPPEPTTEGDGVYIGMNMGQDPSTLDPGYYAFAVNKRVENGLAATRRGTITPVPFNIASPGPILGSGLYNNPNREKVILIAHADQVMMRQSGTYPTSVPIPVGVTLGGRIHFSQQFDKIYLESDNSDLTTLVWDGQSAAGFVAITQSHPEDTTRRITPNVEWSANQADRRVFPLSRNEIGVSDSADYTSYDYILRKFPVNAGTADKIVGAVPFTQGYLLVGKEESWDVLANFSGDLTGIRMEVLSSSVGLSGRETARMVGGDVVFAYRTGVYRIGQVLDTRLQASPLPVATKKAGGSAVDPIGPLIKRINWGLQSRFVAAVLAPYYFLAASLDGSTTIDTLLVYNTVSDEWETIDTWPAGFGMSIDNLIVAQYQGTPALFVVNHSLGKIHVLGQGRFDHNGTTEFEIHDRLETRGYSTLGWNAATRRDAQELQLALKTWRPNATVTLLSESRNDERPLTVRSITRDPKRYSVWGRPNYKASNENDDFQTPGREDYSVRLIEGQPLQLQSGIALEQTQESTERFALKARSRWVSLRIENSQGRCDIAGVLLETKGTQREERRAS